MSLRASYARLTKEDVEALRHNPELFRNLPRMSFDVDDNPTPNRSEWLNLDREWLPLSWMCSPVGRAEERNQAALAEVLDCKANGEDLSADGAFKAAMAREAEKLGFAYVDPESMPDDPVLAAIQGRRGEDKGETIENLGISAALFSPPEVAALANALADLSEADMRAAYNIDEMEAFGVPNDGEESDFDEFYMPLLSRLRTLYERATRAEQHVAVVFDDEFMMIVGEPGPDFWENH